MKIRLVGFFVCFAVLVVGCKTSVVTGRLDEVVVDEVKRWGGKAEVQADWPTGLARWTVKRDRFGTVLQTADLNFEQVNSFLTHAFGPARKAGLIADRYQQWAIPAKVAGVSIWYSEDDGGVRITVVKPMKESDYPTLPVWRKR